MRRFTDYLILLAVLAVVGSCVSKVATVPPPNPMDSIWAGIRDDICRLEETHASLDEWRQRAAEEQVLQSADELRSALRETGLTEVDLAEALRKRSRAAKVIHFGFDCDYHALVFFDKGKRAESVIKW